MSQPQNVLINFSRGIDTKTDPWSIPIGQFQVLQNSIFQKGGLLQKRNGYGSLTQINPVSNYLTTLNDNLISIGDTVSAYSSSLGEWITKGTLQPCSLSVLPLIRNNLSQVQNDTVISDGLVFTTFMQQNTISTGVVTQYMYAISDAVTGQNIVAPHAIPPLTSGVIVGASRVFVVGAYFVIVSPVSVSSGTPVLQYVSIPIANPVNLTTNVANASLPQSITSEVYVSLLTTSGWDAVAANTTGGWNLIVAYNSTTTAQGVHVAALSQAKIALNQSTSVIHQFNNAAFIGAIVSVCADTTVSTNVFYISFFNNSTQNCYAAAVTLGFSSINVQFAPTIVNGGLSLINLASAAQNNLCTIFAEVVNSYSYDSSIPTNYVQGATISSSGTPGSTFVSVLSVGLASKAFIVDGIIYYLSAYQSVFQPSYFLINGSKSLSSSPVVTAKLANLNGGGYLPYALPNVTVSGNVAQISYLYKDDIEALNTLNNPQQLTAGGIYSQEGINLVSFVLGTDSIDTAEIAQNLHISGGYLSHFDGYLPVEHNFFLWPDSIELTYNATSTVTHTGTVATGSAVVTAVPSLSGVSAGMSITGTGIPANTFILYASGSTITMSQAATGNHSAETLTIQGNIQAIPDGGTVGLGAYYYQVTYEWTDNQGLSYKSTPSIPVTYTTTGSGTAGSVIVNGPMLRLTAKVANKVKIVIYRWSEATQVYNQVTNILAPVLNDTTVDSWSFVDNLADAAVVGNNILYTTGGVVPDTNGPSTSIVTLFDTRLWEVDAEDPNLLWVSKQVIEQTPVEMSADFTIYIAPNIGTTGSTGGVTALAPMDDKLIIFKRNAIYYINGVGPNNLGTTAVGCSLGNYSQPIFITSVVGCTNQSSIVLTQDGLMFQSDKGIWLLGRNLQTSYIGAPVEVFNSQTVNSANVIPSTNYVVMTLNSNTSLMYDYYYQQWGTFVGPYPISSCIYQDLHTMVDKYGNILQETPGLYLDGPDPVLMSFTTSWINLATLQGYERFYEFYLLARYLSPHSLLCAVAYDYNSSILDSTLIIPANYSYTAPGPYGVPTPFGAPGDKEQWRIHAVQQLCESFQLTVTEVFNPAYGTIPGAGFTMSGITCEVGVKSGKRPIPGATSAGVG